MFTFGLLRNGVLFAVGLYWCSRMLRRWRSDLEKLCESRNVRDWAVISALWGVTAIILVCMIGGLVGAIWSMKSV